MGKIGLIIKREYTTRVKKKSFLLMTILGPILLVGFLVGAIWLGQQEEKEGGTKREGGNDGRSATREETCPFQHTHFLPDSA